MVQISKNMTFSRRETPIKTFLAFRMQAISVGKVSIIDF